MLRPAHGTARDYGALLAVETAPADELPEGVPDEPGRDRDPLTGRFRPRNRLAAQGGRGRGAALSLARLLGFLELPDDHRFARYHRLAREWREAQAVSLAATVGGGILSPGVSSIIASAALALAASRYLYDQGAESGDAKLLGQGARLADQSRTSLLTAHELCAREAQARKADAPLTAPALRPPPWAKTEPRS